MVRLLQRGQHFANGIESGEAPKRLSARCAKATRHADLLALKSASVWIGCATRSRTGSGDDRERLDAFARAEGGDALLDRRIVQHAKAMLEAVKESRRREHAKRGSKGS